MGAINNTTYDGGANPYAAGGLAAGGGGDVYADMPTLQRNIMQFVSEQIASNKLLGDEGVHVNSILRMVEGNQDRVRQEFETLMTEGHLYGTIDDDQCVALLSLSLSSACPS